MFYNSTWLTKLWPLATNCKNYSKIGLHSFTYVLQATWEWCYSDTKFEEVAIKLWIQFLRCGKFTNDDKTWFPLNIIETKSSQTIITKPSRKRELQFIGAEETGRIISYLVYEKINVIGLPVSTQVIYQLCINLYCLHWPSSS